MNCKKIISLVLCGFSVLMLTACQEDNSIEDTTEISTSHISEIYTETAPNNPEPSSVLASVNTSETSIPFSTLPSAEYPSAWTTEKIIDTYKKAAEKSNKTVKSQQTITLSDISVNNGEFKGVFDFVKPIISKLLANNSTETEGITGGYANLVESDVYKAKAYAVGDNVAIEMVMREQTDGARGDKLSGSVGHAISVVGDISDVVKQLNDLGLPIKISDEHTSIYYTDPVVRVLIGPDGKIINGTWSYTVDIRLNNYKVGGTTVDNTSVVMNNLITVNGGFAK